MISKSIILCLLAIATTAHAGPRGLRTAYWSRGGAVDTGYEWTASDFVMTWAIPSTTAVTVPGLSGQTYDASIYWQSTNTPLAVTAYNDADLTHSYAAVGTYQIIITGTWPAIYFNNAGNKTLIRSVDSWGDGTKWMTLANAFYGCSGMTDAGPALPSMPNVTTLTYAWRGCTALTTAPDVSALTNVTTLLRAWYNCSQLTTVPTLMPSSTALTTTTEAFRLTGSGMKGTVVELWNTNLFPNVTAFANTFTGCTGLDNYADIPNNWKGL